jgi:hypothetical protein
MTTTANSPKLTRFIRAARSAQVAVMGECDSRANEAALVLFSREILPLMLEAVADVTERWEEMAAGVGQGIASTRTLPTLQDGVALCEAVQVAFDTGAVVAARAGHPGLLDQIATRTMRSLAPLREAIERAETIH